MLNLLNNINRNQYLLGMEEAPGEILPQIKLLSFPERQAVPAKPTLPTGRHTTTLTPTNLGQVELGRLPDGHAALVPDYVLVEVLKSRLHQCYNGSP